VTLWEIEMVIEREKLKVLESGVSSKGLEDDSEAEMEIWKGKGWVMMWETMRERSSEKKSE
jgi:hypothetical protein